MSLTDTAIRNAKPKEKVYTLSDGGALYLFVTPSGGKLWRYRFRWEGKPHTYSLGSYPQVGLATAREERDRARKLIAVGRHPTEQKKQDRIVQRISQANTLKAIAEEYIESHRKTWDARYASRAERFLEKDVFPKIGFLPITDVTSAHLLDILRNAEKRGSPTVAEKLRIWIGGVFRYAISTGRALADPTNALRNAIHAPLTVHAKPIESRRVPALIAAFNEAEASDPVLIIGLRMLMLTFVRGNELRLASFDQIDEKDALWRIPADQMKSPRPHVVPLSRQALCLIKRLKRFAGETGYLFPSPTMRDQPISEPMWGKTLIRIGFKGEITPHSFRATASTLLNELGYAPDWIERQLAHSPRNRTRASYNHAQYLPERRRMMQDYADHLDTLCREENLSGMLGE